MPLLLLSYALQPWACLCSLPIDAALQNPLWVTQFVPQ